MKEPAQNHPGKNLSNSLTTESKVTLGHPLECGSPAAAFPPAPPAPCFAILNKSRNQRSTPKTNLRPPSSLKTYNLQLKTFGFVGALMLVSTLAPAQTKPQHSPASQTEGERRGTLNLEAARANPLQLRNLLKKMPKGGDLHNHLSGAVYAESWIRAAADDHLCVHLSSLSFATPKAGRSCPS